jgi:hypothetical protein
LLIFRRYWISGTWHIALMLCQLAALVLVQPTDITRKQNTKCRLCGAFWRWASNARNMCRPLIPNTRTLCCAATQIYNHALHRIFSTIDPNWPVTRQVLKSSLRMDLSLLYSCISDAHWNLMLKHQAPVSAVVLVSRVEFCDANVPYHRSIRILFEARHFPRLSACVAGINKLKKQYILVDKNSTVWDIKISNLLVFVKHSVKCDRSRSPSQVSI